MLPDIRAVIAAIIAAVGLLMISFGLVAMFRVAQENHAGSLQADLAKRGRAAPPANADRPPVLIIGTPAPPVQPVAAAVAPEMPPVAAALPRAFAVPLAAAVSVPRPDAPKPPSGGPLAEPPARDSETSRKGAAVSDASAKAAADKAKKARAARFARERKARRAALARRAKEKAAAPSASTNAFGSTFGVPPRQ